MGSGRGVGPCRAAPLLFPSAERWLGTRSLETRCMSVTLLMDGSSVAGTEDCRKEDSGSGSEKSSNSGTEVTMGVDVNLRELFEVLLK